MRPADVERMIAKAGRTVILRRSTSVGDLDLSVKASIRIFAPHEITGDLVQGDREVKISNKEISASNWPGPPAPGDRVVIDGREMTVEGQPVPGHIGESIAMYTLTVGG